MMKQKKTEQLLILGALLFAVAFALAMQQTYYYSAAVPGIPGRGSEQRIILGMPESGLLPWGGFPIPQIILSMPDIGAVHTPPTQNQSIILGMPDIGVQGTENVNRYLSSRDLELLKCLATHPYTADPSGTAACLVKYQETTSDACRTVSTMLRQIIESQ